MNVDYPIDAVITWVDGNDVKWQQKINPFLEKKIDWQDKKESIRYNSINEIIIVIESIIKFAPFIRNIFLVTDNQVPDGLDRLMVLSSNAGINLEVIDHTVIFRDYENYLPCFNSISIISMLFRIPGLAEHFIVFNDDTFLMKAASKNDFFKGEYPIVRGVWDNYYEDQKLRKLYVKFLSFFGAKKDLGKPGYKKVQQKSAKLLGLKKYIRRGHTPVSIRKSTIENFFKEHPQIFEDNIKHRFRNKDQFMISSLSNHLEAKQNAYHLDKNLKLTYFQSYKYLYIIKIKLKKFTLDKDKLFMCFQNLEIAENNQLNYIINWIEAKLKWLQTNYFEDEKELLNSLKTITESKVLLYPADTVWGLGWDVTSEEAVVKEYEIKNKTGVSKNDYQLIYIQSYKKPLWYYKLLLSNVKNENNKLFCVTKLRSMSAKEVKLFRKWFAKVIVN